MILAATAETLGWLSIDLGLLSYLSVGLLGGLVTFSLVLLLIERRTIGKRREFASRVLKASRLHLPERGSLRFRVSNFNWVLDPNEPAYRFSIAGFNERAEAIQVRDVEVVFLRADVQVAKDRPRDRLTGYRIDHLNFPSREWEVRDLEAGDIRYNHEEVQEAMGCDKVQVVMRYVNGEEFRFDVPVGEGREAAMVVQETRRRRPLVVMLLLLGTVVMGIGLVARIDPVTFLGLLVMLLSLPPVAWSIAKGTSR
jgi:hypothetical protein